MLKVEDRIIVLESREDILPELGDFLDTYVKQYNQAVETYDWIKDRVNGETKSRWESTIRSLKTVCLALSAGFGPCTPPRNWASGQLVQYIAPIPKHVREAIDKADPIFSQKQILIYDPNTEHFQRPKKIDPMAIGFVDLADQRLHFLIGQWDLDKDLKFIGVKKSTKQAPINRSSDDVGHLLKQIDDMKQTWVPVTLPYIQSSTYTPNILDGARWVAPSRQTAISDHPNVTFDMDRSKTRIQFSDLSKWQSKMTNGLVSNDIAYK